MNLEKTIHTSRRDIDKKLFERVGLAVSGLLIPNSEKVDCSKWATIALDQHTSNLEYWSSVEDLVGESPSTHHLILPEAYLNIDQPKDPYQEAKKISKTAVEYLENGILKPSKPGFVLVERQTSNGQKRKGLVAALDLEHYSFEDNKYTLIRETENFIKARLEARRAVRKVSPIETSHIIMLIDDPDKTVIDPLFQQAEIIENKLYDFELMKGGGHIKGYGIHNPLTINSIGENLDNLISDEVLFEKFGEAGNRAKLLYATGDGNHSLTSAKKEWEFIKSKLLDVGTSMDFVRVHPARYALVEMVNIHDPGLDIHSISRVLYGVKTNPLDKMKEQGIELDYQSTSLSEMRKTIDNTINGSSDQKIGIIQPDGNYGIITVKNPDNNLAVSNLQKFLDRFIEEGGAERIDYIHGFNPTVTESSKEGNFGFWLPSIPKDRLLPEVIQNGIITQKGFSIGETQDKRYNIECRLINPSLYLA